MGAEAARVRGMTTALVHRFAASSLRIGFRKNLKALWNPRPLLLILSPGSPGGKVRSTPPLRVSLEPSCFPGFLPLGKCLSAPGRFTYNQTNTEAEERAESVLRPDTRVES